MTAMPSIFCKHPVTRRVFFAMQKHSKKDAQKLHALWLLPFIAVRNTAHEVLCQKGGVVLASNELRSHS